MVEMDRQIDLMARRIANHQRRMGGNGTLRVDDRVADRREFLLQDLLKYRAMESAMPPHAGGTAERRYQLPHSEHW